MAFMRYADASVARPHVSERGWKKVRKAASTPPRNLVAQATEILGVPFNPERYLLTHSTIVASVDVEDVPNVKLGRVKVGSRTVNRKYGDYYIAPQCSQFVNNNGDSWSRRVLMASYQTFIGGHNFLEHVQIEEQSKGRIIDAVARDIGDSIYIDILVATDRRHNRLVQDIESGKMATLSMGCSVEETICTKCGNVAVDETELCDCIKYAKLNKFIDDMGQQRVIAELCGHPDIEDNAGVHFIEASWVATPAFPGAVLRNILEPTSMPESMARRVQAVLGTVPPQWDGAGAQRVASEATGRQAFDFDDPDEEEGGAPADTEKSKLDDLTDQVYDAVNDKVLDQVRKDLADKGEEAPGPEDSTAWTNDNVQREASAKTARAKAYTASVNELVRTASSDIEFLDRLASLNLAFGIQVSRDLYRASLKVGSSSGYPSNTHFLQACHHALGRSPTPADVRVLIRLGKLLSRQEGIPTPQGDSDV